MRNIPPGTGIMSPCDGGPWPSLFAEGAPVISIDGVLMGRSSCSECLRTWAGAAGRAAGGDSAACLSSDLTCPAFEDDFDPRLLQLLHNEWPFHLVCPHKAAADTSTMAKSATVEKLPAVRIAWRGTGISTKTRRYSGTKRVKVGACWRVVAPRSVWAATGDLPAVQATRPQGHRHDDAIPAPHDRTCLQAYRTAIPCYNIIEPG